MRIKTKPLPKRTYSVPVGLADPEALRKEAERRRTALVAGGCSTYTIGIKTGQAAIVCLCCGLGSSNAGDIRERYCGFCHAYHSEWQQAEEEDKVHLGDYTEAMTP